MFLKALYSPITQCPSLRHWVHVKIRPRVTLSVGLLLKERLFWVWSVDWNIECVENSPCPIRRAVDELYEAHLGTIVVAFALLNIDATHYSVELLEVGS